MTVSGQTMKNGEEPSCRTRYPPILSRSREGVVGEEECGGFMLDDTSALA